jgi:hypothetical protein
MNLPMTAVLGLYDPEDTLPEDDGTVSDYHRQQLDVDKPMDVYLHGNSAMMLRRAVKSNGQMKVCLTTTKGECLKSDSLVVLKIINSRRRCSQLHAQWTLAQLPLSSHTWDC